MIYSQNGEDLIISEYFGEFKGHLLDIGANDGITFSNSRLLIQKCWKATLIEPSRAYEKLKKLYDGKRQWQQITTINVGISNNKASEIWYELTDSLLSTKHKELADKWGIPYILSIVDFIPYSHIPQPPNGYDFINIDTEGEDWNILQQIDLTNVKCLCVEYGKHETLITRYCEKYNMKLLHRNGENLIFVK